MLLRTLQARSPHLAVLLIIGLATEGHSSAAPQPPAESGYAEAELSDFQATVEPAPSPPPATNSPAPAVHAGPIESPIAKTLSKDQLNEAVTTIKQAQGLSEEMRAEVLKRLQTAADWLTTGEEAAQRATQYDAESQQAPELLTKAKANLAAPQVAVSVPAEDASITQLEQQLAEAEARLSEAQGHLKEREEIVKHRGDRKGELAKLGEEAKQRLEEAQKQLTSPPSAGEPAELTAARRMEVEARVIALKNQLALFKAESQRLDLLAEFFPLDRDLAKREKNTCEKTVAALQQIVSQRRATESERQAREARRQVQMAHPARAELGRTQRSTGGTATSPLGTNLACVPGSRPDRKTPAQIAQRCASGGRQGGESGTFDHRRARVASRTGTVATDSDLRIAHSVRGIRDAPGQSRSARTG